MCQNCHLQVSKNLVAQMVYFNQITEKCQRNAKIEQLQMQVIEVQIIITNYSNWTWINE